MRGLDLLGAAETYPPHDRLHYVAQMGGRPYSGRMARSRLHRICDLTRDLRELIHVDDEVPAWVSDLIAVAHANLAAVYGYIEPRAAFEA
jgi:hypothetical protein